MFNRPCFLAIARSTRWWLKLLVFGMIGACQSHGEDSAGASEAIQTACSQVGSGSCGPGALPKACEERLTQDAKTAASKGCAGEWQKLLTCWNMHPEACGQVPKECNALWVSLQACNHKDADVCKIDHTDDWQSCSISCSDFEAKCSPGTGTDLSCTCTTGPRSGSSFTTRGCDSITQAAIAACV